MPSIRVTRSRRRSRPRTVLSALWISGAVLFAGIGGIGQADWTSDFAVPQAPAESSVSTVDADPPRLLSPVEARRSVLDRARRLSKVAHAASQRPPRERTIPALPPQAAALRPAAADSDSAADGEFAP